MDPFEIKRATQIILTIQSQVQVLMTQGDISEDTCRLWDHKLQSLLEFVLMVENSQRINEDDLGEGGDRCTQKK